MLDLMRRLGFSAIARGYSPPKVMQNLLHWAALMNLVRRLEINVILDVGANRGFFSKHLRLAGYNGLLISFEPVPEDFRRIRALAARDKNWIVCDYALGAKNEPKTFSVNFCGDQTTLSSFLPLKTPYSPPQQIVVQVRRLDNVLPDLIASVASPRIFLKTDTQGYDHHVIAGLGDFLHKVAGLQSEISVLPLYDEVRHYTESLSHYEELGFSLIDLFVVDRKADGRAVEYDCIMARTSELTGA